MNLTALTQHHISISMEDENLHNSRSPAVRHIWDAFICRIFRYLADQLTVFLGAGMRETFYRQIYRQKVSLGGKRLNYGVAPTLVLQGLPRVGDRS